MIESEEKEQQELSQISERLKEAKEKTINISNKKLLLESPHGKVIGHAIRAGIELASAIFIATIFGVVIDKWLQTFPWAMLIMFALGVIAGFLNLYRAVVKKEYLNNQSPKDQ